MTTKNQNKLQDQQFDNQHILACDTACDWIDYFVSRAHALCCRTVPTSGVPPAVFVQRKLEDTCKPVELPLGQV